MQSCILQHIVNHACNSLCKKVTFGDPPNDLLNLEYVITSYSASKHFIFFRKAGQEQGSSQAFIPSEKDATHLGKLLKFAGWLQIQAHKIPYSLYTSMKCLPLTGCFRSSLNFKSCAHIFVCNSICEITNEQGHWCLTSVWTVW